MDRPIQAGDLAEVVWGLHGAQSPNLGFVVKVLSAVGEHSQHGRIWRCDAEYVARGQFGTDNVPGGIADFAQSWLRRIEPPATPLPSKSTNLETT